MTSGDIVAAAQAVAVISATLLSGAVLSSAADAQDKRVREYGADAIQIVADSGTMHYHQNYVVTFVSGVVGTDLPSQIKRGDVVTVKERSLRANYILVTEYLETLKWGKQVLANAGDVTCVIVERLEDIPSDEKRNRLWIYIKNCKVLKTSAQP